ncbi:MAG: hypothetical protein K2I29_02560 [Clostridia bacterium]|nr:hypothetical protein [Clostridia bacterium]
MSKLLKSILVASLVACMTVCLGLFAAACNNTPEDTDKYFTVTVVLPDDNKTPVKDAEVAICTMNGSILTCLDGVKTDENGVAKSNITSPVDYSDTTKFLVKIHDLPDGYIYADADGNEYGSDEGVIVDTAVSGFSVTVTLTAKPTATPATLSLDTPVAVATADGAKFTASKDGTYLFTVSNFETSWTLGEDTQSDNFAELEMTANETVTLSVDEDCKIMVNDLATINSMEAPKAATLDTPVSFSVMLISTYSRMQRDYITTWGLYNGNYYLNFTSNEAGNYKVSFTSSFDNDDVAVNLTPLDSYTYPSTLDNNVFGDIVANEAYLVELSSAQNNGYSSLNPGDVINYTVTIEYVEDGDIGDGDEDSDVLELGANNVTKAGEYYFENLTAGHTYTIAVSEIVDGYWMVNNQVVTATSKDVTVDAYTSWLAISVNGACTITITDITA